MAPIKHRRKERAHRLVLDLPSAGGDSLGLVLGPSHPVLRGSTRIVLEVEGEAIRAADVQVGLLHRGFEKEAESSPYDQTLLLVERLNYVSPLLNAAGYALAVERLLGVQADIPLRALRLRVIVGELSRIGDHLTCLGATALSLGASNAFYLMMDARARLWRLLEAAAGPRLGAPYIRLGGVARDLPDDWVSAFRAFSPGLRRIVWRVDRLLGENPMFRERTRGICAIDAATARGWGLTGPVARASGVACDVRKDAPYFAYDDYDFDVPLGEHGDNWDRYAVRMEELRQSLRIVEQAIGRLSPGPVLLDDPTFVPPALEVRQTQVWAQAALQSLATQGPFVPAGEVYSATEAANGELGFFIVSKGGTRPVKCRVRAPSFANAAMLSHILPTHAVSDVVPTYCLFNVVGGECDR
ncbi:MAG: NADH-quinone oxidoreductase subunit D [Deltaproteobacteria bacterium]|nr:NADH-quinone oxidoreductase subunit D [Deltaproteobacteria bacterium]